MAARKKKTKARASKKPVKKARRRRKAAPRRATPKRKTKKARTPAQMKALEKMLAANRAKRSGKRKSNAAIHTLPTYVPKQVVPSHRGMSHAPEAQTIRLKPRGPAFHGIDFED